MSIFALAILVDGKPATSLSPGQYTSIELTPGKHSISVPDDMWNGAIAGTPHEADFVTAAGKTYYALPTHWYAGDSLRITTVGSTVVPERVALPQIGFAVQEARASATPAGFDGLTYVPAH